MWEILNKPRMQWTILDEAILGGSLLLFAACVLAAGYAYEKWTKR